MAVSNEAQILEFVDVSSTDSLACIGPFGSWGGPFFQGESPGGFDWVCAGCGAVLVRGARAGQFIGVAFKCLACQTIGRTPERRTGEPVPGNSLIIPSHAPDKFCAVSAAVPLGPNNAVVNQDELDAYRREAGCGTELPELDGLTPPALIGLAARAQALLGEDYERLKRRDRHATNVGGPMVTRHRMIELISYARRLAYEIELRTPETPTMIDADKISELILICAAFNRWREHPALPRLAATLKDATETRHTVILLAAASYLVDAGNGVGIVFQDTGARMPDLWMRPTFGERVDIEVKVPMALRGPLTHPLADAQTERVLTRLLRQAASTSKGQISAANSGAIVVGAYHLGPGAIDVIERAATRVLQSQAARKRHLTAVLVVEHTWTSTMGSERRIGFTPILNIRTVQHPGYSGALTVHTNRYWQ